MVFSFLFRFFPLAIFPPHFVLLLFTLYSLSKVEGGVGGLGFLQIPELVGGECIYHTQVALKREFFSFFFSISFLPL